jgi:hypothetical protein
MLIINYFNKEMHCYGNGHTKEKAGKHQPKWKLKRKQILKKRACWFPYDSQRTHDGSRNGNNSIRGIPENREHLD